MNSKKRYALNFDLDTNKLKEFYPKANWRQAYDDIAKYFKKINFTHRQGSGYLSKELLYDADIVKIAHDLSHKFKWLALCVNKFDVTEVGQTHDITDIIKEEYRLVQEVRKSKSEVEISSQKKSALDTIIAEAEKKSELYNSKSNKNIHNNKDKNDLSL